MDKNPQQLLLEVQRCTACGWTKRFGAMSISEARSIVFDDKCPACGAEGTVWEIPKNSKPVLVGVKP